MINLFNEGREFYILLWIPLSLILAELLGLISIFINYAHCWITDDPSKTNNIALDLADKIPLDGGRMFRLWIVLCIPLVLFVFYKVTIILSIIMAIMYVARATVRLKTVLTSHIEDKKAHKK